MSVACVGRVHRTARTALATSTGTKLSVSRASLIPVSVEVSSLSFVRFRLLRPEVLTPCRQSNARCAWFTTVIKKKFRMPMSAVYGRIGRMSDAERPGAVHGECDGSLRYLDLSTGNYVDDNCGCGCHIKKREWYLPDFGPGPHKILWINNRQLRD